MTPEERAHQVCRDHNARFPNMPNVPIQSVYEWLVSVQHEAIAAEREASNAEYCAYGCMARHGHDDGCPALTRTQAKD